MKFVSELYLHLIIQAIAIFIAQFRVLFKEQIFDNA